MEPMRIVEMEVGRLRPYERNAKKHDEKQIANVALSIQKYGWRQPLVVDGEGVIVIGHCRLEAAKRLGLETVPCVSADDLTDDQIRELRIIDNKLNESEWDMEAFTSEMQELDLSEFGIDSIGGGYGDGQPG